MSDMFHRDLIQTFEGKKQDSKPHFEWRETQYLVEIRKPTSCSNCIDYYFFKNRTTNRNFDLLDLSFNGDPNEYILAKNRMFFYALKPLEQDLIGLVKTLCSQKLITLDETIKQINEKVKEIEAIRKGFMRDFSEESLSCSE